MVVKLADFSGVATKAGLECSDGRTIMPHAFADHDGTQVPLLWSHQDDGPDNVLGHVKLSKNAEGDLLADAYFNPDMPKARSAKALVEHGDVNALSIWANRLVEKGKKVFGGKIKEVSLVLAGANPGALIQNVNVAHGDDITTLDDEVYVFTGLRLVHADGTPFPEVEESEEESTEGATEENNEQNAEEGSSAEHAAADDTGLDVWNSMDEDQKTLAKHMVLVALQHNEEGDGTDSNTEDNDLNNQEGTAQMTHNAFEQNGAVGGAGEGSTTGGTLAHSVDFDEIKENWKRGGSMKHAVEEYCLKHGIENLESLFPDPKTLESEPQFDMRRQEWVATVLGGVRHTPFSRIKTLWADITMEEARALGYIKGNLKKEEFFKLAKRTTSPTWVYKKQKLDRQDIIDATELRVVAFLKAEMQLMLKEEIARAIMIGDGRPVEDPNNAGEPNPDKIADPIGATEGEGIRSILHDHELFAATVNVELPAAVGDSYQGVVENIMVDMDLYKGSGSPTFFTSRKLGTRMLLSKDGFGRRLWRTKEELASEMGVSSIVYVDLFADQEPGLVGIIVNLQDYNVGTDAGGEVTMFDDFDLDYNQYKYLIETRFSGALVKIRSALVIQGKVSTDVELVDPTEPTFVEATGVVTIPTVTHVTYKNADTGATLTAGAQTALDEGDTLHVRADADAGYHFDTNQNDEWIFEGVTAL